MLSYNKISCFLISMIVITTLWTPYIGSWFKNYVSLPAGALVRDTLCMMQILLFFVHFIQKGRHKKRIIYYVYFTIFLCAVTLAILFCDDYFLIAYTGIRPYLYFPLIFFSCYYFINNGMDPGVINKVFMINIVIASIIALGDVFTANSFSSFLGYDHTFAGDDMPLMIKFESFWRANGGFSDALNFGYLMSFSFSINLFNLKKSKYKKTTFFLMILSLITCIASITRGAIIVCFCVFVIYFFRLNYKHLIGVAISALLFLSVWFVFAPSEYNEMIIGRFLQTDNSSAESSNLRVKMMINSVNFLIENPMGSGLGTQAVGYVMRKRIDNTVKRVTTDNAFLHVAVETGVIGFIIYCIVIIFSFYLLFLSMKDKRFFIAISAIYFISGMLSSALMSVTFGLIYWIVVVTTGPNLKTSRGLVQNIKEAENVKCIQ